MTKDPGLTAEFELPSHFITPKPQDQVCFSKEMVQKTLKFTWELRDK